MPTEVTPHFLSNYQVRGKPLVSQFQLRTKASQRMSGRIAWISGVPFIHSVMNELKDCLQLCGVGIFSHRVKALAISL